MTHNHGFPIIGDDLAIGGIPLRRLAARVGRTPFYAYDRNRIAERVRVLRHALPEGLHLSYAVKANPMPALVHHLAGLVDGFDIASSGEMTVALDTGMDARRIGFAGPGKSPAELRQAVAAGITISIESPAELETVAAIGLRLGICPAVMARINPDFEVKGAGMRMGGGAKPFGIDAEQVPAVLERIHRLDLDFRGFHLFWGAQVLRADMIRDAQQRCLELALRLARHAPQQPSLINLGGGFGIPYSSRDGVLDLTEIGDGLHEMAERLNGALRGCRLGIELGRYLVGEAGVYVCKVLDRKVSRGQVFLVTDGGLHHHLAASGNFGQVVRRNYPLAIGTRMHDRDCETATIVGCLCTPLDMIGDRVEVPETQPGDLVVVFQSGAYGFSASPGRFLSHPEAAEVLV
jgi:diaminopimelate decarboxylase